MRQRIVGAMVVAVVAIDSSSARAESSPAVVACIDAATEGQRLRDEGHLLAARARFSECVAQSCPTVLRKDCGAWAASVEEALPRVVFGARDEGGADLVEVRIVEGDVVVAEHLDGLERALDPGDHRLTFIAADGRRVAVRVALRAGEGARQVVATFPPRARVEEVASRPSRPIAPIAIAGGASLAFAGLGTWMVLAANDEDASLASSCAPRCTDADTSDLRRSLVVANVAFGASILALGAAIYFLVRPVPKSAVTATAGGLTLRY